MSIRAVKIHRRKFPGIFHSSAVKFKASSIWRTEQKKVDRRP